MYGSNMQDLFSLKSYLPPVNIICLQAPKVLGHEALHGMTLIGITVLKSLILKKLKSRG